MGIGLAAAAGDVVVTFALTGEAWLSPSLQTISMVAALGVLGLRVLEDGLRPRAEVARLRTYRGEVAELFRKFEAAAEAAAKLALMGIGHGTEEFPGERHVARVHQEAPRSRSLSRIMAARKCWLVRSLTGLGQARRTTGSPYQ
jgi:hypothetical protein